MYTSLSLKVLLVVPAMKTMVSATLVGEDGVTSVLLLMPLAVSR
jgi:hypothetical protein